MNMSEPFPVDQATPAVGATLGAYQLEQVLEQRNPARSFLARDHRTQQTYRLWVLSLPELSPEDRTIYLGRFQQEAGRLSSLKHANLLPLYDYGISQGVPYMVYPSSPMQSLSVLLSQRGPLNPVMAGRYLEQLGSALETAHQQSMWHFNLTTDCILWQESGALVIAELGLVRILSMGAKLLMASQQGEGDKVFSGMHDVQGKPLYGLGNASAPAPELLLGSSVGAPADVYGLGAVLYRMLTGHRVFRGNTPDEVVQQYLTLPIPPLSRWQAGLNPAIDTVLAKAMARDQVQRFQRPELFAAAYTQLISPGDVRSRPSSEVPALSTVKPEVAIPLVSPRSAPVQRQKTSFPASAGTSKSAPILTRRRLTTLLVAGTGTVAAVTIVTLFARRSSTGGVVSATPPGRTTRVNSTVSAPQGNVLARTSDIPANSAKAFPLAGSNNPGLLIHLPDKRFVAFDSTCTHAGCEVAYSASDHLLKCPCHGAVFDPAKGAAVVQGPAQSPLTAIPVTIQSNGTITSNK